MEKFLSDKIEGRLRAIGRSSPTVNAARSECIGALKLATARGGKPKVQGAPARLSFHREQSIKNDRAALKSLKKGADDAATDEIEAQAFVILRDADEPFSPKSAKIVNARRGRVCTITGTLAQIDALAKESQVVAIHLADSLRRPVTLDEGVGGPEERLRREAADTMAERHRFGENVLIGIVDVGGFDFAHQDFLIRDGNQTTTRFLRIWDQGGDFHPPPDGFDFGSEILDSDMNAAIAAADSVGLPPQMIEPQSEMQPGSHGTHVASIAAGNSGICSKAKIAGVLLSVPSEDQDRRLSFYDTTRIVHAVDYLFQLAETLGVDAVTINISLGTNGGAHDDSAPVTRWIDEALTRPGRAVCVAAGNAGQEAPQHAQDIGFVMGRIHTSGQITASGLERRLEWVVVGDQIEDVSENELEIWYEPQDRIAVQVKPPGGEWSAEVGPGEFIRNTMLPDRTFISIFNELYDAGNGCNRISIYLSPFLGDSIVGITPGVWSVRLIGRQIRDGRFHGWIERDDPRELGRLQDRAFWQFPSFFGTSSNVDSNSISTLACGARVIGVANYEEITETVNVSSSQGPTRDGRLKPDIAAPGTRIVAANGFDEDALWTAKTGTSMASPFVAGAVGLLQATAGSKLTAAQILGILRRTAAPLPGHEFAWRNDAGFGAIDLAGALGEAARAGEMREVGGQS